MILKSRLCSLTVLLILAVVTACDSTIPTPPPITVNITAVNNTEALGQAVAEALAATDQAHAHLTETVIANNGITLTPSSTPTITVTPTVTATRFVTATPSPTPTDTMTPTYHPVVTSSPAPSETQSVGWLRFVNQWIAANGQVPVVPVDVYVNEERIASGVTVGNQTNYYQVPPGAIRLSLRNADDSTAQQSAAPIATTIIDVSPGGVVTVLSLDIGNGLTLYPVREDPTPLPVGTSRVTIIQANPALPAVNIDSPDRALRLATNIKVGSILGPFDVPGGKYTLDLNDAGATSVSNITSLPANLVGQVSNFLILLPSSGSGVGSITSFAQWTGLTAHVNNDLGVRFINALTNLGTIQVTVGQTVLDSLPISQVSPSLPVSVLGSPYYIFYGDDFKTLSDTSTLGPFTTGADAEADKLILLLPNEKQKTSFSAVAFPQNPPRSAINASMRFIHGLPGAVPLNLQIRPIRPPSVDANGQQQPAPTWATVGQAEYGTATNYFSRGPETYAIRVVQSGSQTVLAELPPRQFLAGGAYDFIVVPGAQTGSAQLLMVEPTVQVTQLVQGASNPTAVYEAVSGTLTALAPAQVAVTVTQTFTPTPTRTPIPTNTPRPTNTPEFRQPLLVVNPAPPNTTIGVISLSGENFQPKVQYVITLDGTQQAIVTGQVNDDGTLIETIQLPTSLAPGIHSLRVCADCRSRGVQQAAYTQFIIADPNLTPTATAQP